ncbi:MAG TPA: energy-coupling factor transporter ATPase [Anaerolineae bacterium]|nr:energy-coupling factor transporter ATPase [Anaerolineae bacterium]
MASIIAALKQASYAYPHTDRFALKDISLDIHQGEFLGLIGPTGAGKTTFCLALNGIVPQFYGGRFFGHVTVAGLDTLDHPISALARHVGVVFEDPETQLVAHSVENEIAFALENLKIPREEMLPRISRALEAVRLEGTEKRHPQELSGGQKQRLAIAAALALRPDLLILDEPTSQLDPVGAQEVFATVRELNRTLGIAVVMTGHAAEELAEYADRVALLVGGKLVKVGPPDAVYGDVAQLETCDVRPPQVARTFYLINRLRGAESPVPVRLAEGMRRLREGPAIEIAGCYAKCVETHSDTSASLLSVKDLHHVYPDGTRALRGISLDIRAGEYVLIVGQNGAGKSSLVKHFLKLLTPTEGCVQVDGRDTRAWTVGALARRIGYVAQNPDHQIFNATVWDEVAFALKNRGWRKAEVEGRVIETLSALNLLDARDRHPLALPRGDRARVVIAAVLALHPDVLIFDEPTTGQDYRGARAILDITRDLHRQGKTIIVITHHLHLMPDYAERVLVMGAGVLLLDAPIRQAYHAVDVLRSTYLTPPQAVLLAQALGNDVPLLTPEEVAACVTDKNVKRET